VNDVGGAVPVLGVNIAIINEQGRILLTQREDFEIWCLPGGHVDARESLAEAAVREAFEETGLTVQLERLVGTYSTPDWGAEGAHIVLFAGRPVGGTLCGQAGEVIDLGFFQPGELPRPMMWPHERRIRDALAGVGGGAVWSQDLRCPFEGASSLQGLYGARDASDLCRQSFWERYLGRPGPGGEVLEVADQNGKNH
jgi:ADP-ribose pyrophosphatase YjhB (NUDIX family)